MRKLLTELCHPKQWKTIASKDLLSQGYPVYGANGLIGYWRDYNHNSDVLTIGCRGTCGALNIIGGKSYINGNAMCLDELSHDIYIRYLYYYLRWYDLRKIITGTTIPQITIQGLQKVWVDYPSIKKQSEIVYVLDKVNLIIDYYQQQLQKLDDLVKARFVEMFGIPFVNDKHWVTKCIGEVVTEVRYGTSRPAVEGGKYPYLRMNNLTNDGEIDLNNLKYIDIPDDEVEKCIVRKGDVLFNRTNSAELVGKTAMFDLDEEMIIAGYIIRVRLQSCLRPEILSQYMNLKPVKELLHSMAKGAVNQANINAQELQRIEVYIPHIELQREFVAFKKQLDKSKFVESIHVLKLIKEAIAKEVSHDRIR